MGKATSRIDGTGDRERRFSLDDLVSREVERKPFRAVDRGKAASHPWVGGHSIARDTLSTRMASISPATANAVTLLRPNLAELLRATNRLAEAEPMYRRAFAIDEASYGPDHPNVARDLNNLAQLLHDTNRLAEAEPLTRRALEIFLSFTVRTGHQHPHLLASFANYAGLLIAMGRTKAEARAAAEALARAHGLTR